MQAAQGWLCCMEVSIILQFIGHGHEGAMKMKKVGSSLPFRVGGSLFWMV